MSEDPIAFDAVCDLCRDTRRRIILAVLAEERRSLTMDDLERAILAYNHLTSVADASSEVLTDIRVSLCHAHVPKLESAGVIEYDSDRQLVDPTERFDRLQPHLAAILDTDPNLDESIAL
ncbi:DUF7344 domain-containing protein [Halovivax gelatinilyticus]|uniref:DUF7344 domain-containing protein n=1 Tax=Halovivax gelatinilyticus TaxID=2961597 RepID=UPI0020CA9B9F|nr:hypothetical protein [Halovivax gelatinilyticus]